MRVYASEEVILNAWRTPGVGIKRFWTYKEFLHQPIRPETFKEWDMLTDLGYKLETYCNYPDHLRGPVIPCFWYKGNIDLFRRAPMVGIVGSRHIPEGLLPRIKEYLPSLLEYLDGETIASGLALGADTLAHSMSFVSVAFLPCSIEKCYPWSNKDLKARIEEDGLCISPWSPSSTDIVTKSRLFGRTEFLIQCCKTIYVLHTNERSGTEYTIKKALQHGRKVVLLTYGKEDHPLQLKYPEMIVKQVD